MMAKSINEVVGMQPVNTNLESKLDNSLQKKIDAGQFSVARADEIQLVINHHSPDNAHWWSIDTTDGLAVCGLRGPDGLISEARELQAKIIEDMVAAYNSRHDAKPFGGNVKVSFGKGYPQFDERAKMYFAPRRRAGVEPEKAWDK